MAESKREGLTRDQKIIITGRAVRIGLRIFVTIGMAMICMLFAPYVIGEKEFEEPPLTLSQLNAIICVIGILYMWRKSRI